MASICCRLCLLNVPGLRPILDLSIDSNRLNEPVTSTMSQLIICYLSIEPLTENAIATYICSECQSTITKWHWFRESCLQNDGIYRKMAQDPGENDALGQIGEYHVVEVKQEPDIEIGEEGLSENPVSEPMESTLLHEKLENDGRPENLVKAEVKQEINKFVEEEFSENMLIEPLDLPQKKKRNRKGPSKKESLPAKGKEGKPPVKKKTGRPRLYGDGAKPEQQMCTQCGKMVNNMSAHMIMHRQDRRHQCPHCPKSFYSIGMWKSHVNVHTKEIKYPCPVCEKVFWRYGTLRNHMNSHTEEPVFKCPYCPKAYRMQTSLGIHRKTHTQGPDVQCPDCDRKFYSKSQLYKHAVMHMAVKPFVCKVCERGFTRKHSLAAHMEKNHPDWKETEERPTIVVDEPEEILAD